MTHTSSTFKQGKGRRFLIGLRRLACLRSVHPRLHAFLVWSSSLVESSEKSPRISFEHWRQTSGKDVPNHERDEKYREFETAAFQGQEPIILDLSPSGIECPSLDFAFPAPIDSISLRRRRAMLHITGKNIRHIHIQEAASAHFRECFIGDLRIASNARVSVHVEKAIIGNLVIDTKSLRRFAISDSAILQFECPPADAESPFVGAVSVGSLYVPRDRHDFDVEVQMLRNVKAQLHKIGNTWAAGPFHSAELSLERRNDTWLNQIWSWIYEIASDFGNSTARPICWLVLYYVATATTVFLTDGVSPGRELAGWQISLEGAGCENQAARALVYPLLALVSPLSIFGYRPLLVANTTLVGAWLTVLNLCGLLALVLLVFGIRRRFKISSGT